MAGESAFEKRLAAETTMDRVEGLLEHFNLPPKVITFIRRHAKTLKIVLAVVVVVVVSVALYDSYREQQREEAASALARALQVEEERKPDALAKVTAEYSSTTSALWARIELANLEMVKGSFSSAASQYNDILGKTDEESPLFALVLYALAQAYEADAKYGEAFREYDRLKNVKGYENLAYQGMARLEEAQGNLDKAIAIFNNFLLTIGDDPSLAQVKEQVEGDVARLKSRL
jgi:hypothetical protein